MKEKIRQYKIFKTELIVKCIEIAGYMAKAGNKGIGTFKRLMYDEYKLALRYTNDDVILDVVYNVNNWIMEESYKIPIDYFDMSKDEIIKEETLRLKGGV